LNAGSRRAKWVICNAGSRRANWVIVPARRNVNRNSFDGAKGDHPNRLRVGLPKKPQPRRDAKKISPQRDARKSIQGFSDAKISRMPNQLRGVLRLASPSAHKSQASHDPAVSLPLNGWLPSVIRQDRSAQAKAPNNQWTDSISRREKIITPPWSCLRR
jgi:hypothetical protein